MAGQLSGRMHNFMTTNELSSFVDLGYGTGLHAPGLRLGAAALGQVRHHALLAHGLGVQAVRAVGGHVQVGLAENPNIPLPVIETPAHLEAARKAMRNLNAAYLTTILEGCYPDDYLASQGLNGPKIAAGDMAVIGSPLDFVGLNVYTPTYVAADVDDPAGYSVVPPPRSFPAMMLPWLQVGSEATYWAVRLVSELWTPAYMLISENGCPSDDVLVNGHVDDTDRLMFLRNYVTHLRRAAVEGYPVRGYFAWSLLDNFEWAEGYEKRFGLYYTDFGTQKRIPKLSASWCRELIKRNALV